LKWCHEGRINIAVNRGISYILGVALITLPLLAIGGVLWSMEPPPLVLQSEPSNLSNPSNPSNPSGAATVSEPDWWRGAADAQIIIDTFPDFECIACCETEAVVPQTMHFYAKITKMVYHPYPLSELGQVIAEALEAAGEQGKFWELHDKVVQVMPRDVDALKACATEVGLDMPAFNQALDSGKFTEKVKLAKEKAIARGVDHATIFVNGSEYHKYPPDVGDISAMIAEEMGKIRTGGG
jgi:protein-disulfide isomerase